MMIIKKEKDKGSDLPDMRWRIFCPWNLAARKFVMTLNFLRNSFLGILKIVKCFDLFLKRFFHDFQTHKRSSICTTELQKISIRHALCLLPHNTSWSLCQTCCPWPRAWSPSSGGWRGPGRPAGRRWSWWQHAWWTSVWPEQGGTMSNDQWASYALLISGLTCGWTMNLYLSTAISTMLELLRNTEMHWTTLVTLQTQSCNRI